MVCNVCGSKWESDSPVSKCPFCGAAVGGDAYGANPGTTVPQAIAFIINKDGVDVLTEPEKMMSYISDLVMGCERDRKLIRVGSANGAFEMAHRILIEPKQEKRRTIALDMKQQLMDGAFLSDANASAIVGMILQGIGMPSLLPGSMPSQNNEKPVGPEKTADTGREPGARQQPKIKGSAPGAAGKSPAHGVTTGSQSASDRITLRSISTFSYDGTDFMARKVKGPLFLRGETSMIGVLVSYDPTGKNVSGVLDWQIMRQDGTPFSGPIRGVGPISGRDIDFYHGWGWSVPGNWEPGRYIIRASLNGSNAMTTYFEIVEGSYDEPAVQMTQVRLFNALSDRADSPRTYGVQFPSGQATRIFFEIGMKPLSAPSYTTINYRIVRLGGEVIANYAVPIGFHKGDDSCWAGFGWDEPGHWKKGRYSYDVTVGNTNDVFHGLFDIL